VEDSLSFANRTSGELEFGFIEAVIAPIGVEFDVEVDLGGRPANGRRVVGAASGLANTLRPKVATRGRWRPG